MSEKLSLDQLMAKDEGAELPEEILNSIAGGMTVQEWNDLPQAIRLQAQVISSDRKDMGLSCDFDAIVAQLMGN